MRFRAKTIKFFNRHTEWSHFFISISIAWLMGRIFQMDDHKKTLFVALAGGIIPDLDHIISFFTYQRKSTYSLKVKRLLREGKIRKLADFLNSNHKTNTSVYGHNLLTLIITICCSVLAINYFHSNIWGIFFCSWSAHYLWDITEDLIYFGKINPNWYFRFNSPSHDINQYNRIE